MTDRVSKYPDRVRLVPVAGQPNVYDMVEADQPTTAGTDLSKANLLSTAAEQKIFGSSSGDHTVNEAILRIANSL